MIMFDNAILFAIQTFDRIIRMLDSVILVLERTIQISTFWLLVATVVGIVFGWLVANLGAQKRVIELSTTLKIERTKNTSLAQTFEALSDKALRRNNEAFFTLANEKLLPLQRSLEDLEKARVSAYAGVTQQIGDLLAAHNALRDEAASLAGALKNTQIRGRWGEIQLRRVVELAGMLNRCDFFEQQSGDTGLLRPDMIVNLPGGRKIVVDAKTPLDGYLKAMAAKEQQTREVHLGEHVEQIRAHMSALSSKSYWEQYRPSPAFVFMFLPGEAFYSAALQKQPLLIEEGAKKNVILATPTILLALLRAVAYGWEQEKIARSAEQIGSLGKELHGRISTMGEHFARLGSSLRIAVDSYNDTVGSLERRVLVSARRFKDLGAWDGAKEIDTVESIEAMPRQFQAVEMVSNPDSPDG
jgi:DNA recombination protein RmuC